MLKFIIPGYYLFYSRLKSKLEKISWFIIYIFPIYAVGWFYTSNDYLVYSLIFILATLIFNSIYEIGYIENDTKTILNEKKPTLRLSVNDYEIFKQNYYFIIVLKILTAVSLLFLAHRFSDIFTFKIYIFRFVVLLIVIRVLFYLHNKIRSQVNILTFFALATTKYTAPLFLILGPDRLFSSWVITFFLFPLIRTMEHATKEKYGLKQWIHFVGNHDIFRMKYYISMVMVTILGYFLFENDLVFFINVLFLYFVVFRIGSYIIIKKKFYQRERKGIKGAK